MSIFGFKLIICKFNVNQLLTSMNIDYGQTFTTYLNMDLSTFF